jgi:hypothetical protein
LPVFASLVVMQARFVSGAAKAGNVNVSAIAIINDFIFLPF